MTEENLANVNIGVEQILAAILNKTGGVLLTPEDLTADYSQYAVAVDGAEEGGLNFSLVDLQGVDLDEIVE
jgi:hypothetical protein